jgi:hypothetical protein
MGEALLLLVLAAGNPGKPEIELKAMPSMVILPVGGRAATVRFRLTIKDGGQEDYYCPRVEWEWEDDTRSDEESDCPPFDQADKTDHEKVLRRSRQFWEPGRHVIKARLYKGDRVVRVISTTVEVRGDGVPGHLRQRGSPPPPPPPPPSRR